MARRRRNRVRGGRKTGKPKGSCRRKPPPVAFQILAGKTNTPEGRWVPFSGATQSTYLAERQRQATVWKNARNRAARAKAGPMNWPGPKRGVPEYMP